MAKIILKLYLMRLCWNKKSLISFWWKSLIIIDGVWWNICLKKTFQSNYFISNSGLELCVNCEWINGVLIFLKLSQSKNFHIYENWEDCFNFIHQKTQYNIIIFWHTITIFMHHLLILNLFLFPFLSVSKELGEQWNFIFLYRKKLITVRYI